MLEISEAQNLSHMIRNRFIVKKQYIEIVVLFFYQKGGENMGLERLKNHKGQFSTRSEVKNAVKQHIEYKSLNQSEKDILMYLQACALRYYGVCTVLRQTIAEKLSISVSTVARGLRTLRREEIIQTYATRRKNYRGGSGANIIEILPFNEPTLEQKETKDTSSNTSDDTTHTTTLSCVNPTSPMIFEGLQQLVIFFNCFNIKHTLLDTGKHSTDENWRSAFTRARQRTGLSPETLDLFCLLSSDAKEAHNRLGMLYRAKKMVSIQRNSLLLLEEMDRSVFQTLKKVIATCKTSVIRHLDNYLYRTFVNLFQAQVDNSITETRSKYLEKIRGFYENPSFYKNTNSPDSDTKDLEDLRDYYLGDSREGVQA
ncbi:hypothetical protein [Listeria booriae]|nr:hypothetical protein [Listeria booriae]